jgi:HSP20 family molecular chaperone IbpA
MPYAEAWREGDAWKVRLAIPGVTPDDLDTTRVQATCRHGLLELTLPLTRRAGPCRVPIAAALDARPLAVAV